MNIAEEVNCLEGSCPDASTGDDNSGTVATKQTYCPFRDQLCIGADGTFEITPIDPPYADGTYNSITLLNGCLAGLENKPSRGYVAPACCPKAGDPVPGDGEVTLAVSDKQLTTQVGGELLTQVHWKATGDYTVTGCGTVAQPFCISGPAVASGNIVVEQCNNSDQVTVTGNGSVSQPLKICHKTSALAAGNHCGVVTDSGGHVIGINPYTSESLNISQSNCTIEKKPVTTAQTIPFASGSIQINEFGEILSFTPPAGLTTAIPYLKPDNSTGIMNFTDGILTSVS